MQNLEEMLNGTWSIDKLSRRDEWWYVEVAHCDTEAHPNVRAQVCHDSIEEAVSFAIQLASLRLEGPRIDCTDCWGVGELMPLVLCPRCKGRGSVDAENPPPSFNDTEAWSAWEATRA